MTVEKLQRELHTLEEVSEHELGYTHLCLQAACAAAEVGNVTECRNIINRAISMFSQGEVPALSSPLIELFNQLNPNAA